MVREARVTFEEKGQIIYRNVEEKNQHGVADHGDVKHHIVLDKTAERRRRESAGEGFSVQTFQPKGSGMIFNLTY